MKGGSQIANETRTWNVSLEDSEIEVRAVLIKNVPYAATEFSPTEEGDLWLLFLSIFSNDQWVAYGAIDSLTEQPDLSLEHIPIERIKKLSILIGDPWFKIKDDPLTMAHEHRKLASALDEISPDYDKASYLQLIDKRAMTDWERLTIHWSEQGIILSLN